MTHGELGRELRLLRLERGLPLRALATKAGADLTSSSISKIERGERYPNLHTLEALARALHCRFTTDADGTRIEKL